MAQRTVILTICDRCGRTEETDQPAKCYVTPANTKNRGKTWELCPECTEQLDEFLHVAAPTSHPQNHVSGPSA